MQDKIEKRLIRKLTASYVATMLITMVIAGRFVEESVVAGNSYDLGNDFAGWCSLIVLYAGVIIFLYGNAVSFGVEWALHKWARPRAWLYIALHSILGAMPGLWMKGLWLALYGFIAALVFAAADLWVKARMARRKGIKAFWLVPLLTFGALWAVLQAASATLPPPSPFTKEDAVAFATKGKGAVTDVFQSRSVYGGESLKVMRLNGQQRWSHWKLASIS